MTDPTYIGTARAAELLSLSVDTVARMFDEGRLPGFRTPHGHRRLALEGVLAWRKATVGDHGEDSK